MNIFVKPNEELDYFTPQTSYNLNFYLAKKSKLRVYTFTFGKESVKNNLNVILAGEGAKAELYGFYLLKNNQIIENNTFLHHKAPFCKSFQQYYGILQTKGQAIFEGRILVEKQAQKTDAFLENKNIILSDKAHLLSKPILEIKADDVKCTHAFSATQIEEDELFYLRSRGIEKNKAIKILLMSFVGKILNKIDQPSLKKTYARRFSNF
jgi:Fe-S cluster assembly protein SufD